ncbi:hypothetical protein JW905_04170 [bacterium]|nr:hypothetical protein [candidate division CSSED10-310 bacterium]
MAMIHPHSGHAMQPVAGPHREAAPGGNRIRRRPAWPNPTIWFFLLYLLLTWFISRDYLGMPLDHDVSQYFGSTDSFPRPLRYGNLVIFRMLISLFGVKALPLRIYSLIIHWLMICVLHSVIHRATGCPFAAVPAGLSLSLWTRTAESFGYLTQSGQVLWIVLLGSALVLELAWMERGSQWFILGVALTGMASGLCWEHGPLAMGALMILPLADRRHRRRIRPFFPIVLGGLAVNLLVIASFLPWLMIYVTSNLKLLSPVRYPRMAASIWDQLKATFLGEFLGVEHRSTPAMLVLIVLACVLLLIPAIRRRASWQGVPGLLGVAGMIGAAGFISLLFRLPPNRTDWFILGNRHIFFMAPVFCLATGAMTAAILPGLTMAMKNKRWAAILLLSIVPFAFLDRTPERTVYSILGKLTTLHEETVQRIKESLPELPRDAVVEIRISHALADSDLNLLYSTDTIHLNVGARLGRPDLRFLLVQDYYVPASTETDLVLFEYNGHVYRSRVQFERAGWP